MRFTPFASLVVAWLLASTSTLCAAAVQTLTTWSVQYRADDVQLALGGHWPNGCGPSGIEHRVSGTIIGILVYQEPRKNVLCTQVIRPWTRTVMLGFLAPGNYKVTVRSYGFPEPATAPAILGTFEFTVGASPHAVPASSLPPLSILIGTLAVAAWFHGRGR